MIVCPKCGGKPVKLLRVWVLKRVLIIGLFECENGHKFRAKAGTVNGTSYELEVPQHLETLAIKQLENSKKIILR